MGFPWVTTRKLGNTKCIKLDILLAYRTYQMRLSVICDMCFYVFNRSCSTFLQVYKVCGALRDTSIEEPWYTLPYICARSH